LSAIIFPLAYKLKVTDRPRKASGRTG